MGGRISFPGPFRARMGGRKGVAEGGEPRWRGPSETFGKKQDETIMEAFGAKDWLPSNKDWQKGLEIAQKKGGYEMAKFMLGRMRAKKWKAIGYDPDDWENMP